MGYVRRLSEHYLLGDIRQELGLLCRGFEDLLPQAALQAQELDARDLELLLCGIPQVFVDDWQENAVLNGPALVTDEGQQLVDWFWEALEGFGEERRAKLLQFSTGAARLPPEGFAG